MRTGDREKDIERLVNGGQLDRLYGRPVFDVNSLQKCSRIQISSVCGRDGMAGVKAVVVAVERPIAGRAGRDDPDQKLCRGVAASLGGDGSTRDLRRRLDLIRHTAPRYRGIRKCALCGLPLTVPVAHGAALHTFDSHSRGRAERTRGQFLQIFLPDVHSGPGADSVHAGRRRRK